MACETACDPIQSLEPAAADISSVHMPELPLLTSSAAAAAAAGGVGADDVRAAQQAGCMHDTPLECRPLQVDRL
jgi:hypothetical protein